MQLDSLMWSADIIFAGAEVQHGSHTYLALTPTLTLTPSPTSLFASRSRTMVGFTYKECPGEVQREVLSFEMRGVFN